MFCKKCGAEMPDGTKFCPSCGAPTDGSPAAQPEKKKKKHHPVLGAILVVVGILILVGLVSGGGDKPEKVSGGNTVAASQPTEPETFTVGDAVKLRDVVVTLVNVTENNGGNYMTPSDGKVFVVCEFEIENNSSKDIAVSSIMSFEAYFDDYSTSMNLSAMLSTEKTQLDGTIAAGKKMNGVIGYEVDPDWKNVEIRFTPDFWAGKEITFTYSK